MNQGAGYADAACGRRWRAVLGPAAATPGPVQLDKLHSDREPEQEHQLPSPPFDSPVRPAAIFRPKTPAIEPVHACHAKAIRQSCSVELLWTAGVIPRRGFVNTNSSAAITTPT